ncbi:adenylate/guanylate cyclase domain-containing protein [Sneathiella sp.]|uniref:adenylate/guanylate cyclase domain-containing protein n=1 Tax=Sneathiella sp. TaxID=1964365 RepID=UPI0039E54C05
MSDTLRQWLADLDLEKYIEVFRENEITFDDVSDLNDADLKELGLPMGPRKRILRAVNSAGLTPDESTGSVLKELREIPRTAAERRLLTVVFCDLVGSTALSQQLDPEDLRHLINQYENTIITVVKKYGGFVAKFLGDGALIYFGWPLAHEDQAVRAIYASLDILSAVKDLSVIGNLKLQTRVGIASGEVVVGNLDGETERGIGEVTGVTPNLAARLQSAAKPDQIAISAMTKELVGQSFILEELAPVNLKGFEERVPLWLVVGEASVGSRFTIFHEKMMSEFVGQTRELSIIRDAWNQACHGQGQFLIISGEAGIGKSRIIEEIRHEIRGVRHLDLQHQCSAFHTNSAFFPIIQRIKLAANITYDDTNENRLAKLEMLLEDISVDLPRDVPLFASLLSLPYLGQYKPLNLPAHQRRVLLMDAIVNQLRKCAQSQPVLFVLEDAHWIDPTTETLILEIMPFLKDLPILMIVSHRPDYTPPSSSETPTTVINLKRLGLEHCRKIASRLGGNVLKPKVIEEVAKRAEGIPLYVEEMTRSLLDNGSKTEKIPISLQASLIARLDRLAEGKIVAQIGAVIGREFSGTLIEMLVPMYKEDIQHTLRLLVRSGLVTEHQHGGDVHYVFKHALIQNAAYEALLRSKRLTYHSQIADVYIRDYPEVISDYPQQIAHHLSKAHRPVEAADYWMLAGKRAAERSEQQEAVFNLEKALRELKYFTVDVQQDEYELGIRLALGASLLAIHGWSASDVKENYDKAATLGKKVGTVHQRVAASHGLANVFFLNGKINDARTLADQELETAIEQNDQTLLMGGHRSVGMCGFFAGDFRYAADHLSQAISLYDRKLHSVQAFDQGTDPNVIAVSVRSWANWFLGKNGEANKQMKEAVAFADRLNHPFSTAYAKSIASSVCQTDQNYQQAQEYASEAREIAAEFSFPYWLGWASIIFGWSIAALGDCDKGLKILRDGQAMYESTGALQIKPYSFTLEAEIHGWAGRYESGLELLQQALVENSETDVSFYQAETLRLMSKFTHFINPGSAQVKEYLNKAMAVARQQNALALEQRTLINAAYTNAIPKENIAKLTSEIEAHYGFVLQSRLLNKVDRPISDRPTQQGGSQTRRPE